MEVILLERIAKLGQMGEKVRVKDGFARNFLLPNSKALRATKANIERFENERAQLEARNLEQRQEAEFIAENLNGSTHVIIRQSGESGHLYGSVTTRNVADLLTENGVTIQRNQVSLQRPVKTIGIHEVNISLHPEVEVTINLNVARTEEEAERQARGEILVGKEEESFEFESDETTEDGQKPDSDEAIAAYFDQPSENKTEVTGSSEKADDNNSKPTTKKEQKSKVNSKSSSKSKDESNTTEKIEVQTTHPEEDNATTNSKDATETPKNSGSKDDAGAENSPEEQNQAESSSKSDTDK